VLIDPAEAWIREKQKQTLPDSYYTLYTRE
jgi:hypothetical protein